MAQRLSKKILNICIVFIILVGIIFTALMLILNYNEKGETNMPFSITKISIVSTVDGQDVEDESNKWNIKATQNNDIFIYIQKNVEYKKQETISQVKLSNFTITQKPEIGEIKLYKPINNDTSIFKNEDKNIFTELEFNGTKSTDTRNLEISNQGGVLSFRCSNIDIGSYISNEDIEINYNDILKKMNIFENKIMCKISFDITISLNSKKQFKAENIELTLPNEDLVEKGTVGKEYTDLQNIVFKRVSN